jgi:hypothetical protein
VSDQKTPLRLDAASSSRDRRTLSNITLPSEPGNERQAMEEARAVSGLGLPEKTP